MLFWTGKKSAEEGVHVKRVKRSIKQLKSIPIWVAGCLRLVYSNYTAGFTDQWMRPKKMSNAFKRKSRQRSYSWHNTCEKKNSVAHHLVLVFEDIFRITMMAGLSRTAQACSCALAIWYSCHFVNSIQKVWTTAGLATQKVIDFKVKLFVPFRRSQWSH